MRKLLFILALPLVLWALPAQAANCNVAAGSCFWIGGTGTMDMATDSAHWSNTDNGTTCTCEPTSTSVLNFTANAGGGTITTNANWTSGSVILTGFTGTFDVSANNNSPTITATSTTGFTGTLVDVSGTHTLNMGSGTWTLNSSNSALNSATSFNLTNASLTLSAASSTIIFTQTAACNAHSVSLSMGGKTYGTVALASTGGGTGCPLTIVQNNTFNVLTLTGPVSVLLTITSTQTVSTTLTLNGSSGNNVYLASSTAGTQTTLSAPVSGSVGQFVAVRDIIFTSHTPVVTTCFNLGNNTGVTCNAPVIGTITAGGIIGG